MIPASPAEANAEPAENSAISPVPSTAPSQTGERSADPSLLALKDRVHKSVVAALDFESLGDVDRDRMKEEVRRRVRESIDQERGRTVVGAEEREELVERVLDDIFGLGPLEPLLRDPTVTDILVNGPSCVWVERHGKLGPTGARFDDEPHLRRVIDRMVSAVGRRVDESSPLCDARLLDGSRLNVVIPPIALDGSMVSIRKFKRDMLGPERLVEFGSITQDMVEFLRAAVGAKMNILISGGTGAGKTSLLNILSSFVPHEDALITIEDAAELQLRHPFVRRLETRPKGREGTPAISQDLLVFNSLRMRPERIILGEVRGAEAVEMLNAMNTGHPGSLATLHANSPRDALSRLETMISMAEANLPEKAMRQQIARTINLIVQAKRLPDGTRKVTHITEIVGMEGEIITLQDIFVFEQQGVDPATGKVIGKFAATGVRPRCADDITRAGFTLPPELFGGTSFR